jgi:Flp pilus assembly protein TadD
MGILLARTGKWKSAEPLLEVILARSTAPEPEVACELARIYLETFRLPQAEATLLRWARDAPRDATPYFWLTEVDSRTTHDARITIAHYRTALERDPGLARARLGLAEMLRSAHLAAEAAREYETYLTSRPDDATAHLGLGQCAAELGDERRAVEHLDRALELAPDNAAALRERAAIAEGRGDDARALALLDRALQLEPREPPLWHRRGLVLGRLGRRDEARRDQAQAERLRQELAQLGEFLDTLVRDPGNTRVQYEVTRFMIERGYTDQGIRWARKLLRERPGHAPTCRLLADLYEAQGNTGLANYYRLQAQPGTGGQGPNVR